jgi:drug/metabolite transporter (DMT)-like permease
MKTFAHDSSRSSSVAAAGSQVAEPSPDPVRSRDTRLLTGLTLAVVSAASFGMSGPLARGLLDTGWSPGAAVLVRLGLAALVVAPFGAVSLRGQWGLLRRNAGLIIVYGISAVAGAQYCYFSAVTYMQVGPALLIEYTAPAAVVIWLWLRHGQRPGALTLVGAGLAALGLVLVLGLLSGTDLSVAGVLWALGAMVGAASYFVISADHGNGLPPLALAGGGLLVGTVVMGLLGLVGLLPMRITSDATTYAGHSVPWLLPVLALGLVTAALSYTTGIAAGRRLGSRLASFVALLEVVAGVVFAWLLLGELPRLVQLLGGVLILGGVLAVKLGERNLTQEPAVG